MMGTSTTIKKLKPVTLLRGNKSDLKKLKPLAPRVARTPTGSDETHILSKVRVGVRSTRGRKWQDPWPRFFSRIYVDERGCWNWLGSKTSGGYGEFSVNGKLIRTHRWAYEALVGPIPPKYQLDHLCRNRGCANPGHLEAVTQRENLLRGISHNRERTHCKNGHQLTQKNIRWMTSKGKSWRQCKECYP